jgi:hypothetical protein
LVSEKNYYLGDQERGQVLSSREELKGKLSMTSLFERRPFKDIFTERLWGALS